MKKSVKKLAKARPASRRQTIALARATTDLDALVGQRIALFCLNYIYAGTLAAVTETDVRLTDPQIVYETGAFSDAAWKDAQSLPGRKWHVMRAAIESYGAVTK